MEYEKINLLDNTPNQSSIFRIKNWVDDARRTYNTISQIKGYNVKVSLCNYSNTYALGKGTMTITGSEGVRGAATRQEAREADGRNKGVIFRNSVAFTDYISRSR